MRSNPFGEARVHDCLTGRSDGNRLGHLRLTAFRDPCDFRSEARDVVLFFVQGGLGHEHGEVDVLHAVDLELCVSKLLDLLPDEERSRAQDVAP